MIILNETTDENIERARMMIAKHLKDREFLELVKNVPEFNYSKHSGKEVSEHIFNFNGVVILKSYTPLNPFTKAIAYADDPNIFFNSKKNLPAIERIETIAHEIMHIIGYSHRGNFRTKFNLDTVPYKVGMMFKKYCQGIYW